MSSINSAYSFLRVTMLPCLFFLGVTCANAQSAMTGPPATKITIDTTTMTSPAMAGRVKGIFDSGLSKFGVKVEYTQLSTTSQMLEGLLSGSVDIVELGYVGVATGAAAGVPFTVIGAASNGGGDLLLLPKNTHIKQISDLKGKTIAITKGSSAWVLLLRMLDSVGLSSKDVNLINLQPDEGQNAFLSGQVDAWAVWAGSKSDSVNSSNSITLFSAQDAGLIPGIIAVRNAFLQRNESLVIAYLKLREQAFELLKNDPVDTSAAIGSARNVSTQKVEAFFKINSPVNDAVTDRNIQDMQKISNLLYGAGEIKKPVNIKELVNNRFMKEALAFK